MEHPKSTDAEVELGRRRKAFDPYPRAPTDFQTGLKRS
jgi:hypothetical protein